jgi:hypothetical protein
VLYLTIREGSSPRDSSPILVSADQGLISSVAKLVAQRLVAESKGRRKARAIAQLHSVPNTERGDEDR